MKNNLFAVVVAGAATVLAIILVIFAMTIGRPSTALSADVHAVTTETNHNWGDIGINDGKVTTDFTVKNTGTSTLKIHDIVTSCMCTSAQFFTADGTSPVFGMHTESNYVVRIAPGENAKLTVTFDPLYHGPDALGPITRTVTMATNDLANPTLGFFLTGNVIK